MLTAFVIDGFNFYHSIKPLQKSLRWFNYNYFCKHFLKKNDEMHSITYCTAVASYRPNASQRHRIFIEACRGIGIEVLLGKFKSKTGRCPHCGESITRHEEKETDVNIALALYRLAAHVDQLMLVSGDTDMIPSIQAIKADFPKVKVGVIFPYNRVSTELKKAAHFHHKTSRKILANFILPLTFLDKDDRLITCPAEWR